MAAMRILAKTKNNVTLAILSEINEIGVVYNVLRHEESIGEEIKAINPTGCQLLTFEVNKLWSSCAILSVM